MAESGLDPLSAEAPAPAPFEPQAALAALKLATEKLKASAGVKADPWLAMSAGFGAPTKTGNFFESLGNANQGLTAALQRQREAELENAKLQASMIGMQADLPLKAMQAKMLGSQMEGMSLLGSGGDGNALPLTKGMGKTNAGIAAQGGPANLSAVASAPTGAPPAQTIEGEAPQIPQLPKGIPPLADAYAAAKPPPHVAAATQRFAEASGATPLYDVGKMLQTGLYYQTIGAKYNLPQAGEIGRSQTQQALEFIKQGVIPVRFADGTTGVAPIPGYLQKTYVEHAMQNRAKWNEYGSHEKAAERANTRDRLAFEAQLDPKTTYDAYGNPQAPVSRFDLAMGTAPKLPGGQTGVPGGVTGAPGTPGQAPVPGQAAPVGGTRTMEIPGQLKPVIEAEGKYLGELPTHLTMKQQELTSIEKMADAYKLVQSGKFAAHKAELSGVLRAAGVNPDDFNLTKRDQVQIALKEAMRNTLTSFKDIPAGSRFSQAEFMAMKNEGMANPDMEPEANLAILSGMHGVARNDLAFMSHLINKVDNSGGQRVSVAKELDNWYKSKPLKASIEESRQQLGPFKGMTGSAGALDPIAAEIARRAAARPPAVETGD